MRRPDGFRPELFGHWSVAVPPVRTQKRMEWKQCGCQNHLAPALSSGLGRIGPKRAAMALDMTRMSVKESVVTCSACGSRVLETFLTEHARTICTAHPRRADDQKAKRAAKDGRLMAFLKKKSGNPKRRHVDRSLFSNKEKVALTTEQAIARRRIDNRGFHEGAAVPGSTIRKVDK